MHKTHTKDLVGINECARQIGVAKSTLSKLLKADPHLWHGSKVSVSEVKAHRENTINPAHVDNYKGELFGDDDGNVDKTLPSARGSRARYEEARAKKAELELAREMDQIVPIDEVQGALIDATTRLHEALERAAETAAGRISPKDDKREIKLTIKDAVRAALEGWAHDCGAVSGDAGGKIERIA